MFLKVKILRYEKKKSLIFTSQVTDSNKEFR